MRPSPELIGSLRERFSHAVIVFVDDDGYPISVATDFDVDADGSVVTLRSVAGEELQPPEDERVSVVFSHIRPQPGVGYDERRYVTLWGTLERSGDELRLSADRVVKWDEQEIPFFEYSERSLPQARRYYERVSAEQGREVKPQLSRGWLFLRATRLPFLSATFVPILLGIAVAAQLDGFNWWVALLTLVGGACIHLAANVFNDVFDTASGADEANVTPTQFSGGSRVILYGLVSKRGMTLLAAGFGLVGIAIGMLLAATRGWDLVWLGIAGALIAYFYTAPPLRLVHHGLGEIAVGIGFGPIMALGAYYAQAQGWAWEPLLASLPVGVLVALILYVNEVPDRHSDAKADKRTLVVRLSKENVIRLYDLAIAVTFGMIAVFAIAGWTARPTLIALLALPLVQPVRRALREAYDQPYVLMGAMGKNINLHMVTGLLLIVGYVIAIVAEAVSDDPPAFLT